MWLRPWCLALTVTLIALSCSGGKLRYGGQPLDAPVAESPDAALPIPQADLPAFPPTGGRAPLPLHTSAEQPIGGKDWMEEAGSGNRTGTTPAGYVILPGSGEKVAWAVYGLSGLVEDRPAALGIEILAAPLVPGGEDDLPVNYWVGLGNYSRGRWEWQGPYSEPSSFSLNSVQSRDRYVSSSGDFYFAVLCDASGIVASPGNPDGLAAVEVVGSTPDVLAVSDAAYHSSIPIFPKIDGLSEPASGLGHFGSRATSAAGDPQVEMDWTHVFDPGDPGAEAFGYRIYRKGPSDLNRIPIGDGGPSGVFVDPSNNYPGIAGPVAGLTYEYSIRAFNNNGWTPFSAKMIALAGPNVLPPLDVDALYAIPAVTSATVGQEVLVTVASGATANAFLYQNMVSVTVPIDADYVPNSFNPGADGGGPNDVDGLWTSLNPTQMFSTPDAFVWEENIGSGLKRIEFSLAPLAGTQLSGASGELFTFRLVFNSVGTYPLSFQQSDGVRSRTYYTDANETAYFWGDVTNNHTAAGVANSISVN